LRVSNPNFDRQNKICNMGVLLKNVALVVLLNREFMLEREVDMEEMHSYTLSR